MSEKLTHAYLTASERRQAWDQRRYGRVNGTTYTNMNRYARKIDRIYTYVNRFLRQGPVTRPEMSADSSRSRTEPVAARVDVETVSALKLLSEAPVTRPSSMSEAAAVAMRRGLGLESDDE